MAKPLLPTNFTGWKRPGVFFTKNIQEGIQ